MGGGEGFREPFCPILVPIVPIIFIMKFPIISDRKELGQNISMMYMYLSVSQRNFDPEQLPLEASENDVTSAVKPVPLWELTESVTRENVTMGTLNSNT